MGKYTSKLIRDLSLFLISLCALCVLGVCSTGNIFANDFFNNQDVLIHTNCHDELLIQESVQFVTYYDFRLNPIEETIRWHITNKLFIFVCPNNISKVIEILEEISILSLIETAFVQNLYFITWPELASESIESVLTLLNDNIIKNIIKTYPMNVEVYICVSYFNQSYKRTQTALIEVYSVARQVPVIQVIWDNFSFKKMEYENLINKIARRWNFHRAPIRGLLTVDSRYRTESVLTVIRFYNGISNAFNFTLVTVEGTGWIGESASNNMGTHPLTGMGQQILSGEADIILQTTELLMYRAKYLHMSPRIYPNRLMAILHQPPSTLLRNIYVKAFDPDVWIVYTALWIILITSVYTALLVRKRKRTRMGKKLEQSDYRESLFQETQMWFIATLTMQGMSSSSSTTSLKIIRISGLAMVIMCYTFYASSLFYILSHQKGSIQNYDDLVKSNVPVLADNRALKATELLTDVYTQRGMPEKNVSGNIVDPMTASRAMLKSSIAVLTMREVWYLQDVGVTPVSLDPICDSYSSFDINIGATLGKGPYVHRNSSLRKFLLYPIFVLYENGLIFRQIIEYFKEYFEVSQCQSHKEVPGLGNNDVFTVYIVLGIGMASSIIILLIERALACVKLKPNPKYKT